MKRILFLYAVIIAIISILALLAQSGVATLFLDHWKTVHSGDESLPFLTNKAPLICRLAMVVPVFLLILSLASFKSGLVPERLLIHGMAITSIAVASTTFFVATAGIQPAFVTITEVAKA